MCGICGAFSPTPLLEAEVTSVLKLLTLNSFRGVDSTGMMTWHKKEEEFFVEKKDVHPFVFALVNNYKVFYEKFKKQYPNLLGYHCRAATVGKITEENAHPFHHGNIIGMHNGTVLSSFPNRDKFDTDSEALIYNISKLGIEEAIGQLDKGVPAYAIVYIDTKEQTLNFIRNSSRPLGFIRRNRCLYWSSDTKDLHYVFPNYSVSQDKKDTDGYADDRVSAFETDKLYTIDLTKGDLLFSTKAIKPKESWSYGSSYKGEHRPPFVPDKWIDSKKGKQKSIFPNTSICNRVWDMNPVRLPFLKYSAKEWEMTMKDTCGINSVYCIEFDKWIDRPLFKTLCVCRLQNKTKFIEMCRARWSALSVTSLGKVERLNNLSFIPMSQNQYKRMLRKGNSEYMNQPWFRDVNGQTIYVKILPSDLKKAEDTNVIPFDDPPFDTSDDEFYYGRDNISCTELIYLQKIDRGCAYCSNPVADDEFVYWLDNKDFLCEACQQSIMDGEEVIMSCFKKEDLDGLPEFFAEWQLDDEDGYVATN